MKTLPHMTQLLEEARAALARPQLIKTEEGRTLMTLLVRLLEVQVEGKPTTPMPARHHV